MNRDRDSVTSSFPTSMSFISTSCLIVLARTFIAVLNRRGESRSLYLVADCRGNIQSFTIKHDISCEFFIDILYQVRKLPFTPGLLIVLS